LRRYKNRFFYQYKRQQENFMKIGVLGSGIVGETLSNGFLKHGYEVMRASREPQKLKGWAEKAGAKASTGNFEEAAKFGEVVVLAVKGTAAEHAVELCGSAINGKAVLDATNPIADAPPVNGVLQYFTSMNESLMERLQKKAPQAKFVKCFNSVGSSLMVDPMLPIQPTMFICGNDEAAKSQTKEILKQFGWEAEDMGSVEAARPIEALCMLWCIPGFKSNEWMHAFKMLR
jgi:predicted dinucleotide-binding enzyme